jgi:ankyrin repeat protein
MLIRPSSLSDIVRPAKHSTPAKNYESIEELVVLCAQGKLYDVEQWIAEGKPIQCERMTDKKMKKKPTPLRIAAARGFYSLAELLLVNGYNTNIDYYECLTPAVAAKNQSMVELLLRFGADPSAVDFSDVLGTYDRGLIDCFMAAGVDPCADNALAKALESKARPLLGFVKTYKERFPGMQRQVDIALHNFVDQEDVKGVCFMLWVGANPYVKVPRNGWEEDDNDDDMLWFPLETAMIRGNEAILLNLLKVPFPPEAVQKLFRSTSFCAHPDVVKRLLKAGANPNDHVDGRHVLDGHVRDLCHSFYQMGRTEHIKHGLESLRLIAEAGAKWDIDNKGLAEIRRSILHAEPSTVNAMLEIFRSKNVLNKEQIEELTRTPSMKSLLAGHRRPKPSPFVPYTSQSSFLPSQTDTSSTRGYWKRHWSQR